MKQPPSVAVAAVPAVHEEPAAAIALAPPDEPFQLLEINIISAQELYPAARSMATYAVAWIQPDRKLCTRVDSGNHTDPQWNDKFIFRVSDWFLRSETSAVMIEIYCTRWFKDTLIGTVRVLVGNLIPTGKATGGNPGMKFTALQVRRPSGRPQGILNLGVTVLDGSMRSMPLYTQLSSALGYRDLMGENFRQLRRTKSAFRSEESTMKGGKAWSVADTMEGSELFKPESVIEGHLPEKIIPGGGGSIAHVGDEFYPAEVGSSILEDWSVASSGGKEELRMKLERWRNEFPPIYDHRYPGYNQAIAHRRGSPEMEESGGEQGGLLSCFGLNPSCECSISCGVNPRKKEAAAAAAAAGGLRGGAPAKVPFSPPEANFRRMR